ncbi:MAG: amino acid racemase [bacterium]|nr:amino acid racemase [bacterium]
MKKVGIIGGIGPEATKEYYHQIVHLYTRRRNDGNYPEIIINSINMKIMLDLLIEQDYDELIVYLSKEINRLFEAGADFGALTSNTPHIIFEALDQRSPIPLISIVEEAGKKAKNLGLKRLGLFGTKFTMQGDFYHDAFSKIDISIITPAQEEQDYIHDKYFSELINGIILDETKSELLNIINKMKDESGIQGLILGGTELPLIIKETGDVDIPVLDTTKIHVESIVNRLSS